MSVNTATTNSPRYRWVILIVTLLAFVAFAFSFQIVPPLIPSILREFNITNAEAGWLMSAVLIPGLLLGVFVSNLIRRLGAKMTILLSLTLVILGTLSSSAANSYAVLLLGRLILGLGGAIILPTTPSIISQWFDKEELGKAMGIFAVNMPLATIFALPLAGTLSLGAGWRYAFYLSAAIAIAVTIVFATLFKEKPITYNKDNSIRKALRNIEIWKVAIIWLLFQASMLSFVTWTPALLERYQGMAKVEASFTTSILSWVSLILVPIYGALSDRLRKRKLFFISGFALMTLMLFIISLNSGPTIILTFLALGAASSMIPPIVQTMPSEILGLDMASVGFGVLTILGNIGPIFAPPLIGYVLDSTNSYFYSIVILAVLTILGTVLGILLKSK
jgi:predicted MFS family arabinose efflux permease